MPFYEAVGRDVGSFQTRTLQISARSDQEAIETAAVQGITEIKLRPYSDREMLMLDLKCFLNAQPNSPARTQLLVEPTRSRARRADSVQSTTVGSRSLLLMHPIFTITSSVLLALLIYRAIDLLIARL